MAKFSTLGLLLLYTTCLLGFVSATYPPLPVQRGNQGLVPDQLPHQTPDRRRTIGVLPKHQPAYQDEGYSQQGGPIGSRGEPGHAGYPGQDGIRRQPVQVSYGGQPGFREPAGQRRYGGQAGQGGYGGQVGLGSYGGQPGQAGYRGQVRRHPYGHRRYASLEKASTEIGLASPERGYHRRQYRRPSVRY